MKDFLDRINVWSIFVEHKDTLYDYAKFKKDNIKVVPNPDKIVFLYLPIIIASIIVLGLKLKINTEYLNIIITSLSIFVGLLFSLLILVFDLLKKEKTIAILEDATEDVKNKYQLLKELFVNISFAVSLSILTIVVTLLTQLKSIIIVEWLPKTLFFSYLKNLYFISINIISIALILAFLMTLLMILKRFFIIFKTEISE